MPFDPQFPIGHLHKGEQDRIRAGNLSSGERALLARGEDPWAKFRGPSLPEAARDTPDHPSEQDDPKSEADERQPTDEELLEFMSAKTKETWRRTDLTPQDRARIWQGNKKIWRRAQATGTRVPGQQRAIVANVWRARWPELERHRRGGSDGTDQSATRCSAKTNPSRQW